MEGEELRALALAFEGVQDEPGRLGIEGPGDLDVPALPFLGQIVLDLADVRPGDADAQDDPDGDERRGDGADDGDDPFIAPPAGASVLRMTNRKTAPGRPWRTG